MAVATSLRVAGVRFTKIGKLYHFDTTQFPDLEAGDHVIVETARGRQLGQIMGFMSPEDAEIELLKPIKRPANPRDLMVNKLWEAKSVEALIDTRELASTISVFNGVKFVKARYNYDGSILTVLYASEDPVDTNSLRKKMLDHFDTRVDLRRIGARDAAKLLGEYGACGAPRCCSTFLTEFSPISIKMAKAQGISLNPSEITGMCGRLRCCLVYEYEQYVEARRKLPKRGKWVNTVHGEGKIIDINPLGESVTVIIEGNRHEVSKEELEPLEELKNLKSKAAAGCTKEGQGGACECGARVRSGNQPKTSEEIAAETQKDMKAREEKREEKRKKKKRRGRKGHGRKAKGDKKTKKNEQGGQS